MEYIDIAPVLSIAGSDCSGGAGIQADIKTIQANGCYAMTAITALTAQNTLGVFDISEVSPEFLAKELDAIFTDIPPRAIKIGMVSSPSLIGVIADKLMEYKAENVIVDPVMVSTSGSKLISNDAIAVMEERIFPIASIITPNIPEAMVLASDRIENAFDMERVGLSLCQRYDCAVLMKGGHSVEDANDLLVYKLNDKPTCKWIYGKRIDNPNTHGTGCTLSSAIASCLAKGETIENSVISAKEYITGALEHGINLGKGSGPLNHGFK